MALDFVYTLRDEEEYAKIRKNSLIKRLEKSADERENKENHETKSLIKDMLENNLSSKKKKILDLMFYLKFHYHYK
ncbi:MAG: hypothetical protein PHX96_07000 [Candidatus Nanoarchaeia archaeon]|nr:hypothetical protein [Candidatus Nanoarchaeia archaeon]